MFLLPLKIFRKNIAKRAFKIFSWFFFSDVSKSQKEVSLIVLVICVGGFFSILNFLLEISI